MKYVYKYALFSIFQPFVQWAKKERQEEATCHVGDEQKKARVCVHR